MFFLNMYSLIRPSACHVTFGLEWTVAHGDRKASVNEQEQPDLIKSRTLFYGIFMIGFCLTHVELAVNV